MTPLVRVSVPGIPQPQGSARAFRRGQRIIVTSDNPKLRDWRDRLARALRAARAARYDGPVRLHLRFAFVQPRSAPRRRYPVVRPDLDKCVRGVCDALTDAGVWRDDAQLVELAATKCYAEAPGVEIIAWPQEVRS